MFRPDSKQIKGCLTDLHKTGCRFILFAKYYCRYIAVEMWGGAIITHVWFNYHLGSGPLSPDAPSTLIMTRAQETTMHSVLVVRREMEGHLGNPSVIGRIILKCGQKMSEKWKRGPSGSQGGPVIPANYLNINFRFYKSLEVLRCVISVVLVQQKGVWCIIPLKPKGPYRGVIPHR